MKSLFAILFLFILAPFSSVNAAPKPFKEVSLISRISSLECGGSAIREGEFFFGLVDTRIPWGSRVKVIFGFRKFSAGRPEIKDWADIQTLELGAFEPYAWRTFTTIPVQAPRTFKYSQINFVFEITLPDGTKVYEKGNNSTRGFYMADLETVPYDCPPRITTRMEIHSIIRN